MSLSKASGMLLSKASGKRKVSAYMVGDAIPIKKEEWRREILCNLPREDRERVFWNAEVRGRGWEGEFNDLWSECFEGPVNERRRDDLTMRFMAPYPNQEITGTPTALCARGTATPFGAWR